MRVKTTRNRYGFQIYELLAKEEGLFVYVSLVIDWSIYLGFS